MGQALDVVAAPQRIDDLRDAGLLGQDQLRVAGNSRREGRRQGHRLIQRVGVQALGTAEHGGHGLDGGAHHVVICVVLGERDARCLAMGAQHRRARILGPELRHQFRPQQTRRPQLGDFHEEVHADGEEEAESRSERVNVQPASQGRPHVFQAVGQGEGQFLHRRSACFLHVVAGDRDGIEARHPLGAVDDDVGNDAHARRGRIDVGVADHELLEDVVLDGSGQLLRGHALFLGGDDEAGHDRQDGAVHGHRHAHLIERDAVEQDLHVLDGIDGDAGLADIADDPGMIGVIAAMGGQIEGDRQALLAGGEVVAEEGVGLFGRREPGVLADGPGAVGVHGGAWAAQIGRHAGQGGGVLEGFEVGRRVQRSYSQSFRGPPQQFVRISTAEFPFGQPSPLGMVFPL